ncbi:hypothetical protein [Nannocystis pusilla]|uniref:hypothetical protein n=1 Tax=Nannocystis pusilla TaxID=889268 RepID=UPI003DA6A112
MISRTDVRRRDVCGWTLALSLLACGSDTDPLDSVGATRSASGPEGDPSAATTATATTTATTTATDTATDTAADPTSTGGAEPSREVCDAYLDCLAVTSPEQLPQAQEGFGPMGTCWQGTPESMQQCIDACATALGQQHELFPDEPKCFECEETADCPAGERCTDRGCVVPMCGDGIVDDGEVCDFPEGGCQPGCDGPLCNPFNHAPCPEGTACGFLWFEGDLHASCVDPEPLPVGTPCGSSPEDLCGAGQICVSAPFALDCADTFCCTPLCNLQDGALCPNGGECDDFLAMTIFGNQVGICVPP